MPVQFFSLEKRFYFNRKTATAKLIEQLIHKEKKVPGNINYIFCSDAFLLKLNKKFLNHTTLTDIITFQYSLKNISGELYISMPRVKENAKLFSVSNQEELLRVIIHGALHLCGYKDKNLKDKQKMTRKENYYLKHFSK